MQDRRTLVYMQKNGIPKSAKKLFNYDTGIDGVASGITAGLTIKYLYIPYKYTLQHSNDSALWDQDSNYENVTSLLVNETNTDTNRYWVCANGWSDMPHATNGDDGYIRTGTVGASSQTSSNTNYYLFPYTKYIGGGGGTPHLIPLYDGYYVKWKIGSGVTSSSRVYTHVDGGSVYQYWKESDPIYYE